MLGNGDFFGQNLSFTSLLAIVCAGLSVTAVLLLPRLGWTALRQGIGAQRIHRLAIANGAGRQVQRDQLVAAWLDKGDREE